MKNSVTVQDLLAYKTSLSYNADSVGVKGNTINVT